jgi:AcrR family transcriptional regulator
LPRVEKAERATTSRRGPYAKTAARRREILRTAIEVFAEYGYHGSSVREIAARVGMSETGLTHHFGGKAALLAAVIEERDAADHGRWSGLSGMHSLIEENSRRPGIVALFTLLSAEATAPAHPAHAFFTSRYEAVRREGAERVRAAQRDGSVRADLDPEHVAQVLIALMDGLQVQWLYDRGADMVAAFDTLMRTWLAPPDPVAPTPARAPDPAPPTPARAPDPAAGGVAADPVTEPPSPASDPP